MQLYLDTSVISAYFDHRTPERQAQTVEAWKRVSACEVFISEIVLHELEAAAEPLRSRLLDTVKDFTVLSFSPATHQLALKYVEHGIFPERYFDDAHHVAMATVAGIEYLLSWNFHHLVKVKTRHTVNLVNRLEGYREIEIIAPPEL